MCGIVGYIGPRETKELLIDGLRELEYRGYDSAGIAVLQNGNFKSFKALGKLINLEEKCSTFTTEGFAVGIGHTRWATHGKPTELNAHPHMGQSSYVVHNGIIENYQELKNEMIGVGKSFLSQTDTEVIVHLFEYYLDAGNAPFDAFQLMLARLEGAFAILLVTTACADQIFFAKHGSPLIIGTNTAGEMFFGSSDAALIGKSDRVVYLQDGDFGLIAPGSITLYDSNKNLQTPNFATLPESKLSAQKEGYRFFMEKEIYEQKDVIADTLLGRLSDEGIRFDELDSSLFEGINAITFCSCGTSYHAALTASYLFERHAKIETQVAFASEFRYREPLLRKDALFVVISQSGETADTLESLKMAKATLHLQRGQLLHGASGRCHHPDPRRHRKRGRLHQSLRHTGRGTLDALALSG